MNLTPFDTGERAEPKPWITGSNIVRDRATGVGEPDEYGKVDFDDDESRTVATVHVSKDPVTGSYVVHVVPHDDDVRVARHGYDEEVVI